MRLSNGIAKIEDGIGRLARSVARKAGDAKASLRSTKDDLRISVLAAQQADLRKKYKELNALDRQEVELRASEINALRDAALVRKAERKLRRDVARNIIDGKINIDGLIRQDALEPRS